MTGRADQRKITNEKAWTGKINMGASTFTDAEYKQTILDCLPDQGCWSEERYLWLTDHTTKLVEFTDGYLEPLPMPNDIHQSVLRILFSAFLAFLTPRGGVPQLAGIRLRIRQGKIREPDIAVLIDEKDVRRYVRFWTGADLALEVASPDNPERDIVEKRADYAEGGVPEYWIVNPQNETITVLRLENDAYVEHGTFRRGQIATSIILDGFAVRIDDVFNFYVPPDAPDDED